MYIEISKKVTKTKVYEYILLRKSIRDKQTGKIKKVTLANLSNEPIEQVMTIVNAFNEHSHLLDKKPLVYRIYSYFYFWLHLEIHLVWHSKIHYFK